LVNKKIFEKDGFLLSINMKTDMSLLSVCRDLKLNLQKRSLSN